MRAKNYRKDELRILKFISKFDDDKAPEDAVAEFISNLGGRHHQFVRALQYENLVSLNLNGDWKLTPTALKLRASLGGKK